MYPDSLYHPSLVELARAGNIQAIAHWLNHALMPYQIRAYVGGSKPGCLKVLVEFQLSPKRIELSDKWRSHLVRFICHRVWKLNSSRIEGVRIAARAVNSSNILWEQSVKVVSPARRARKQQSTQLQSQIQQTASHKAQLKMARSLLMSGPLLFAFVFGCVLGFNKAPVEQTNASASPQSDAGASPPPIPTRPDMVQTALETVPVVKHNEIADPTDPTVTLMFAGDVTLSDAFSDAIGDDYERTFADMNEYRLADLAMVNLENPITRADTPLPDKQFNFKADPEAVKVLTGGGVDLVNLANNHAMDYQEPGLVETIDTLKQAGIQHIGAGQNAKQARRPEIIDVKGQRVAYLGYYSADFESAADNKAGTNFAEEQRIAEDIRAIRDQVDWIVVNYHWGEELATHPADWQIALAHFTIDQGADVIVGHHPHVLQGAEIYRGRPIAYSLGNFIFGGNSRSDYDTAVLKVALKDKQMKVEFLPVEVRGYQPKVVSGDRGSKILQDIDGLSAGFKQPMTSPVILDAQLTPAPPADTVEPSMVEPKETDSTVPETPASVEPVGPSDIDVTDPANKAVDRAGDAVSPADEPFSDSQDSASPSETAPETVSPEMVSPEPAPPESGNTAEPDTPSDPSTNPSSTDSFIDSPQQTPFRSMQPDDQDGSVRMDPPSSDSNPYTSPASQDDQADYQGTNTLDQEAEQIRSWIIPDALVATAVW